VIPRIPHPIEHQLLAAIHGDFFPLICIILATRSVSGNQGEGRA